MSVKKDVKKKEKKVSINLHLSMKKFKFALNEAKEFLYSFFLPLQKYSFDFVLFFRRYRIIWSGCASST